MEGSLRLEDLRDALGEHRRVMRPSAGPVEPDDEDPELPSYWQPTLPTPEELQEMLASTEVRLFLNQREIPESLLTTAWYLHGVASARGAAERYAGRQRSAFALSAHIFDLASQSPDSPNIQILRWTFSAQVGYHRSQQEPNAIAMGRRATDLVADISPLLDELPALALRAGIALLGLNIAELQPLLRTWRAQLRELAFDIGIDDLTSTMFGPTYCVVEGAFALTRFLTTGDRDRLNAARQLFDAAVRSLVGDGDHDARWVASHLRFLTDEMEQGSVWSLLPPDIPPGAKQAFTLTPPFVLTLWEPQRKLLAGETSSVDGAQGTGSALNPSTRRILLSVPTSAGKTLLAQLIIVAHLAGNGGGVCYVAPQRSLGREVRKDLGRRLRVLAREIGRDDPDFQIPVDSAIADYLRSMGIDPAHIPTSAELLTPAEPDLDIMTPERLAHALRDDPEGVLNRYSLFVFDEAHLIAESSRGFLLESTLAFLHWRTRQTHHRIVLLSAALGNAGQLAQWLRVDEPPTLLKSEWRGPRRLHAIFNTRINWRDTTPTVATVAARGKSAHLTKRLSYDTYGVVRLRPTEGRQPAEVSTTEPIGLTCYRATADGVREHSPESGQGTQFYKMAADVIRYVGHAGPVLVIESTRNLSVIMAQAIAAGLPEATEARTIAEFAEIRLGIEHPLPGLLRKGVAYHHAGLPVDLQEAIEEATRNDVLRWLVATTTLTEGVNLPVRTVVIAAVPYPGQPTEQQLIGARLINAVGRAGRATKESEGWVIMARAARPSMDDFAMLEPGDEELEVRSRLLDEQALAALAVYEDAVRAGEDALTSAGSDLADFVAFVWFVLAAAEEVGRAATSSDPFGAFASTLAYAQMPEDIRRRYEAVVATVSGVYEATDPTRRRRWAKTRTSIASAKVLDELSELLESRVRDLREVAAALLKDDPTEALSFLDESGVFDRLLELPERPKPWAFHRTSSSQSPAIQLAPAQLIGRWLSGIGLAEIADELLTEIPARSLRLERLVDTVTDFCEHYFSWMIGALLAITNERLSDTDRRIVPDLPLFVRYGVTDPRAVHLLLSGVRSRELATRIAAAAAADNVELTELRAWLSQMSLPTWGSRFGAAATDLADLLEYARPRGSKVLRTLLSEGTTTIKVLPIQNVDDQVSTSESAPMASAGANQEGELVLRRELGHQSPSPIAVFPALSDVPIATIPISLHAEVQSILDTGLQLEIVLVGDQLTVSLEDQVSQRGSW